jgi:hypothetical protein
MLTKFASFEVSEVLDVKGSPTRSRTASIDKISDFEDYNTDAGYMYVRIRAISSRVNKNADGWPSIELAGGQDNWDKVSSQHTSSEGGFTVEASKDNEYGYSTFIGKPIFVDHNNSNPKRARGVIVDSKFNVLDHKTAAEGDSYWGGKDVDEEHFPPAEVELLLEVDAENFPKFAKAIVDGDLDGFSMGCDVDYSKCSHCGNKASSPDEYCDHIVMKGAEHKFTAKDGTKTSKKSYENCYGIKFFEISGVFDPADETALAREVKSSVVKEAAAHKSFLSSRKTAQPEEPQSFHTTAPEDVDTMRKEKVCPLCGSDMDADQCQVCGYEEPPEQLQNPDLTKAREVDELTDKTDGMVPTEAQGDPHVPTSDAESYLNARGKKAASSGPKGDEPEEVIISDQTTPITSKTTTPDLSSSGEIMATPVFRTAKQLIALTAKRNQENKMSNQNKVAAEPADPSGKPKAQVDVTGVGGVDEASAEAASKADARVDVLGTGGVLEATNEEAAKPDHTESLTTANPDSDDSGFNKDKTTDDSGKTKTFPDGNNGVTKNAPAVTQKAFAAKQGVDPVDAVGKADERVNVDEAVSYTNPNHVTDQWTGTDGNGVNKQQNPVTNVPTQSGGVKASGFVSLAALKLADAEIELGITSKDDKYNRLAALADVADAEIAAELRALAKVKTAGLSRTAAAGGTSRLPSFKRIASEAAPEPQPVNDALLDNALFTR